MHVCVDLAAWGRKDAKLMMVCATTPGLVVEKGAGMAVRTGAQQGVLHSSAHLLGKHPDPVILQAFHNAVQVLKGPAVEHH